MATMGDDQLFLDTNVLVYANAAESPLHEAALSAIETRYEAGIELWSSRQVLREFLATMTRPQTFLDPRPVTTVVERVRFFEDRFRIAEDNARVTERLLELMEQISIGGRQVHDANIVATMQANGVHRLLTHNVRDFKRFAHLIEVVPLDNTP
jgi:predicted nucleic acid-binding protein